MVFPIIRIKDHDKGGYEMKPRIVGTDNHDRLYIRDNAIHYINLQNHAGTEDLEDGYSFVTEDDTPLEYTTAFAPEVEMMSLEEIIALATEEERARLENDIKLYRAMREHFDAELAKTEKETGVRVMS